MNYNFEEERVVKEIREKDAKRVLLQFPEGLKYFSIDIVKKLKEKLPNVDFIISGEPSWGACDIAEDEAQQVNADLIIHFGHTLIRGTILSFLRYLLMLKVIWIFLKVFFNL
nr:diphthamide synthesis protein [Sulfolobus islandicus]